MIGANYEGVLVVLFIVALIFPVAFYHHSWSLWLGFDYLVSRYQSPKEQGFPVHKQSCHTPVSLAPKNPSAVRTKRRGPVL